MKPGSVVVDLAAETGGNIETTKPGEIYSYKDVTHVGLTDLPSRLPNQSSLLYANNIFKFLMSMGEKDHFYIDLEDEVVRGSIVLKDGQMMWPPPKPATPPPPPAVKVQKEVKVVEPPNPMVNTFKDAMATTTGKLCLIIKKMVIAMYGSLSSRF